MFNCNGIKKLQYTGKWDLCRPVDKQGVLEIQVKEGDYKYEGGFLSGKINGKGELIQVFDYNYPIVNGQWKNNILMGNSKSLEIRTMEKYFEIALTYIEKSATSTIALGVDETIQLLKKRNSVLGNGYKGL